MKLAALAWVPISILGGEQCLASCPPSPAKCGPINIAIQNADSSQLPVVPDAVWGLTNCQVKVPGGGVGPTITCPTPAAFIRQTNTAYSYVVVADDAASTGIDQSGTRIPYVGTVGLAGTADGTLTLSQLSPAPIFPTGGSTLIAHAAELVVNSPGTGYSFGSTQRLICSCAPDDGHSDGLGRPAIMTEGSATIIGSGTAGTPGACTLTSASQVGLLGSLTLFVGSISSSGSFALSSIPQHGEIVNDTGSYYTTAPYTGKYLDSLSGCGYTTAPPTATISYKVEGEQIQPGTGIYPFAGSESNIPCWAPGLSTSSNDAGKNLTLYCGGTVSGTSPKAPPFLGSVSFGTDNTQELQAAVGTIGGAVAGTMNYAAASGTPECLYLPAGNYLTRPLNIGTIAGVGSFFAEGYGCWLGDEHLHTNVFVIPNSPGWVFGWRDSNSNNSLSDLTGTQTFANYGTAGTGTANQAGSSFRNITVIGDRLSTAQQTGLAFFGQTQFAYIDNIGVFYLNGNAILAGGTNGLGIGNFADSVIQNVRLEFDGEGTNVPTLDIRATGAVPGSHNLDLLNVRVYQSFGPAIWIHNTGALVTSNAENIRMANIKVEGSDISATTLGGDLIELGDPAASGVNISNVTGRNVELTNAVLSFAALHIAGLNPATTSNIDIEGLYSGQSPDDGRGLQVQTCTQCRVQFARNGAVDYDLMIGNTLTGTICSGGTFGAGAGLVYNGNIGTSQPSTQISACLGTWSAAVALPTFSNF